MMTGANYSADDRRENIRNVVIAALAFKLYDLFRGAPPQEDKIYTEQAVEFVVLAEMDVEAAETRIRNMVEEYTK
jgi:hypothetical protein